MSRNKIFIITGAIISLILVALLIMMQFIQGDASAIDNSYTIEIQNCGKVANENELMKELKAALQPSELKGQNGTFMSPMLKINNLKSFGAPIYGMNYVAFYFNAVMYVYSDRKKDTDLFFDSYAKSDKAFKEIMKQASEGTKKEIKVTFDLDNTTTEFIIGTGKADKKKTFNSLQDLRTQLDELINKGKITKGTTVKVYFICGDLTSLIDDDGDGVMNTDDKCPEEKGLKEFDGCMESKKDTIKIGGSGTVVQPIAPPITTKCPSNVSIGNIMRENGMLNKVKWNISNLTPSCKIVVSVYTVSNKQLIKASTVAYNITEIDIPVKELYDKYPKIKKLECYAKIDVYCDYKVIASRQSDFFTLNCKLN